MLTFELDVGKLFNSVNYLRYFFIETIKKKVIIDIFW